METTGNKIKKLEDLVQALAALRAGGKKIVHCHGVFDLLHIGHIKHLEAARQFGDVLAIKRDLVELLGKLKQDGKRVAAYGASAKGSTVLNFFELGRAQLDFVVDRSTHKQGRLTPGTYLPILPPEQLLAKKPDYTLLLTWNFADEILTQQKTYRDQGGKFIVPIPKVAVL